MHCGGGGRASSSGDERASSDRQGWAAVGDGLRTMASSTQSCLPPLLLTRRPIIDDREGEVLPTMGGGGRSPSIRKMRKRRWGGVGVRAGDPEGGHEGGAVWTKVAWRGVWHRVT
jgi:hypothetical protein